MPSHFSTIGFDIRTEEDLVALANELAGNTNPVKARNGKYLRWRGTGGEELWLQVDRAGELIGMHPHFDGPSLLRIGLASRVRRSDQTALDGAFHCWADPENEAPDSGAYPFVFDVPDSATYKDLEVPGLAVAQVAAFAHEVSCFDSEEEFNASQSSRELKFAPMSFIPSGMFGSELGPDGNPEAMAIFTGSVAQARTLTNQLTAAKYYWAQVDTLGGKFDVVVDPTLLASEPRTGNVLSGSFWLSGRLRDYPRRRRHILGKLLGDAG